jgi:hypothetical protein
MAKEEPVAAPVEIITSKNNSWKYLFIIFVKSKFKNNA